MELSTAGADFIKAREGLRLKAYLDTGGVWTIGYGAIGPGITQGTVWTKAQADARFDKDVQSREEQLTKMLDGAPTTQNQFDALLSLGYNIGMARLSTSTALRLHKQRKYRAAAAAFLLWNKDNGKINAGLINRRKLERDLYLNEGPTDADNL